MKPISTVLSAALFAFTMLYGCTQKHELENHGQIIIENTTINVPCSGGSFNVSYSITGGNNTDTPLPEISCDAQWITIATEQTEGAISFSVSENTSEQTRETSLEISHFDCKEQISVIQEGIRTSYDITIKEIGELEVTFDVLPPDNDHTYIALCIDKEYFDGLGSDDKAFEDDLEYFKLLAEENGMSLSQYLTERLLHKGELKDKTIGDLTPATAYYVYTYGLNADGTRTSKIFKEPFESALPPMQDVTFGIEYTIDGPLVTMTITPSDNGCKYYYDVVDKADPSTLKDVVQEIINEHIKYGKFLGMSLERVLEQILVSGKKEILFDNLEQEHQYTGFAVAVSSSGIVCSEVSYKDFATEAVQPSDNIITVNIDQTSVNSISYTTTPSNSDTYVTILERASDWEGYTSEQILERLGKDYDWSPRAISGTQSHTETRLLSDTEYLIFAFGYQAGTITTDLFMESARTQKGSSSAELTFTFKITDVTDSGASVTVTPDPLDATYYFDYIQADWTSREVIEDFERKIQQYIEYGYYDNAAEYWEGSLDTGVAHWQYEDEFDPDTEYKIFAFGVDAATGEITTGAFFSETFRTLK